MSVGEIMGRWKGIGSKVSLAMRLSLKGCRNGQGLGSKVLMELGLGSECQLVKLSQLICSILTTAKLNH